MSQSTGTTSRKSSVLTIAWTILLLLVLLALLFIVALIVSAGVLLIGRILAQFFEVRVFEAALIALGVAFGIAYMFYGATGSQHVLEPVPDDWEEDEDWDDYEDDEDFEDEEDESIIPPRNRDDPCPCGSGKKYKHCHGKS